MMADPFIIAIDQREKLPYTFAGIDPPVTTISKCLKTGDYSIAGMDDVIAIERKSLSDLYLSLGKNRKRFAAEMLRMKSYDYAAVIVEADLYDIIRRPPPRSQLNPKSVIASMIAFSTRYSICFWACTNRAMAEKLTYKLLHRFYKDAESGLYHYPTMGF